uniref:Uncharacterized protein n=1 Tax=Meloidogyne enterolobii TaxID=390850 RepID=A0A6V7WB23_MELEN|nr:unnamed protein product [Meloidogyne enterolobii]
MSSDSEIDVVGVEEEQNPTTSSRVKKAYSIEKKIEVIEFAKKNSNHAAARRFGVSRSSVIDWRAQEGKLRESKRINKRLPGGGRSLRFMESDEQLANWVRERRKEKVRVTRRMIQQQAIKMFPLVTKKTLLIHLNIAVSQIKQMERRTMKFIVLKLMVQFQKGVLNLDKHV